MMKRTIIFLYILFLSQLSFAKEIPSLTGPVIDEAGILSPTTKAAFERILRGFKKQYGPQIQLYIVKSLEDESLEGYSIKVVDKWKLGDEKKDDGLLFMISMKEKKMRLEVGQGLEGTLTDMKAGRIVDHLRSHFKKGEYEKGIYVGLNFIIKVLGGDIKNIPQVRKKHKGQNFGPFLIFALFILFSLFRRGHGTAFLLGSSYNSFGGGGFSSGGGDFGGWSGGGGGFSGGGASGSW
ncbi:TPM domain-containing protein [Bacteriovoracales bacterium]|nr:TPM domain-containing protein [Bacteriovoracales bacterium]